MKSNLLPAIKLTVVCVVLFSGVYTVLVWGTGQIIAPNHGLGETITYPGEKTKYGFVNIGQSFTADYYFWSRPSAVSYNASGSGASNKGPTNGEYLALVKARIDTFLVHNPAIKRSDIPVEMVTASGSGLDPDISLKAALVQVPRIASARNIPEEKLAGLVHLCYEKPLLGLFGPGKINVLELNIALDKLR